MNNNNALFYGSLKSTHYNFNRFLGQKLIKPDIELSGYDMYSLIHYPAICKGKGTIKCELHEIDDDSWDSISVMERNAGYTEERINIDGIQASLFVMSKDKLKKYNAQLVKDGNWK